MNTKLSSRRISNRIILEGVLIFMCITSFVAPTKKDSPFVVYKGDKYYKCFVNHKVDTLHVPAGFMIITTEEVFYDVFKCDGIK
jgi:uncharacterized membrane protein